MNLGRVFGNVVKFPAIGIQVIQPGGIVKVLVALFISPVLGLIAGFIITRLTLLLARNASPGINWFFRRAQYGARAALEPGSQPERPALL